MFARVFFLYGKAVIFNYLFLFLGKLSEASETDSHTSKPKLTYDVSGKFWGYVEPYCADITPENIVTLEETLSCKMEMSDYYKIPPLGKHYTEVWAKEDFVEEQQQVSKVDKKRTQAETNITSSSDTNSGVDLDEPCPYGSFTQRLVAALVDENIMAPMTGNEMQDVNIADQQQVTSSKVDIAKSSKSSSFHRSLESVVKEQLFSLGLIDSSNEDELEYDADDEIFLELQKCQSELKALVTQNKNTVTKLVEHARAAMKKQEVKQKAKVIDAELVDIFRRFSSSKVKKKGLSRKDREVAWKTLREREAIWKLVDNSDSEKKNQ